MRTFSVICILNGMAMVNEIKGVFDRSSCHRFSVLTCLKNKVVYGKICTPINYLIVRFCLKKLSAWLPKTNSVSQREFIQLI